MYFIYVKFVLLSSWLTQFNSTVFHESRMLTFMPLNADCVKYFSRLPNWYFLVGLYLYLVTFCNFVSVFRVQLWTIIWCILATWFSYQLTYDSFTYADCGLYMVGSSTNGFGGHSSDMDLCLMLSHGEVSESSLAFLVILYVTIR